MWAPLAAELSIPWRAAEAMHWQLGEADMARRAGVVPFSLAANTTAPNQQAPSLPQAGPLPPVLSAAQYMPGTPAHPGTPGSMIFSQGSPRGAMDSFGPRPSIDDPRRSSVPGIPIGVTLPTTLSPVSAPMASPAILPSMAELERGLTAFDAGGRFGEHRQQFSS